MSVKHVKDSPSSLAFLSPKKRQIISELVTARNTIKNKFRQAYRDRIKREREISKALKPVTTSIAELKSIRSDDEKKKIPQKKDDIVDDKIVEKKDSVSLKSPSPKSLSPKKWSTSTPAVGTKKKNLFGSETESESKLSDHSDGVSDVDSELFHTLINYDDDIRNKLMEKKDHNLPSSTSSSLSRRRMETPKTSVRKKKSVHDARKYTYEVEYDNDSVANYSKPPGDDLVVHVTRTDARTGKMTPAKMKWRNIPYSAQKRYLNDRQRIDEFLRSPKAEKVLAKDKRIMDSWIESAGVSGEVDETVSSRLRGRKKGGSIKTNKNKLIDFNFIPYDKNNRVIYEYFDDPNELCDRLRLLVSSRMAGNTNHMQEINSIIEELRELDYIF